VVGISTGNSRPAGINHSLQCIVHDAEGRTGRASHFTYGLLGKDREDSTTGALHGCHMTGRCDTCTVAKPKTGFQAQAEWFSEGGF